MDEFKQLEHDRADVVRLADVYTGLSHVRGVVQAAQDSREPLTATTVGVLRAAINQELTRVPHDVVIRQVSTENENSTELVVSLESISQNLKAVWDALVKKLKALWENIKAFARKSFNRIEALCRNLKTTVANLDAADYMVSGAHLASLFPGETTYDAVWKTIPTKLDAFLTDYQSHNDRVAKALNVVLHEAIDGWKTDGIESKVLSRIDQLQHTEFSKPVVADTDLLLGYVNPDFRELTQQFSAAEDAPSKLLILGDWHPTRNREKTESQPSGRIALRVSTTDVKQVTEDLYAGVKGKFDRYVDHVDAVLAGLTTITREGYKITQAPDEVYSQHAAAGNMVQSLLFRASVNLPSMYTWSTRYLISAFEVYEGVIRSLKPAEE